MSMTPGQQLASQEAVRLVLAVLADMGVEGEPTKAIVEMGTALIKIGEALNGLDLETSRRVMRGVKELIG